MAAKAIQMEQLKQILQLKRDGFSIKAIARYTDICTQYHQKIFLQLKHISKFQASHQQTHLLYFLIRVVGVETERPKTVMSNYNNQFKRPLSKALLSIHVIKA